MASLREFQPSAVITHVAEGAKQARSEIRLVYGVSMSWSYSFTWPFLALFDTCSLSISTSEAGRS